MEQAISSTLEGLQGGVVLVDSSRSGNEVAEAQVTENPRVCGLPDVSQYHLALREATEKNVKADGQAKTRWPELPLLPRVVPLFNCKEGKRVIHA